MKIVVFTLPFPSRVKMNFDLNRNDVEYAEEDLRQRLNRARRLVDEAAEARQRQVGDRETPVTLNMFPQTLARHGVQQDPPVQATPYQMQMPSFVYAMLGSFGWTPYHGVPGYHPVGCYPVAGYQMDGALGGPCKGRILRVKGSQASQMCFPDRNNRPSGNRPQRIKERSRN